MEAPGTGLYDYGNRPMNPSGNLQRIDGGSEDGSGRERGQSGQQRSPAEHHIIRVRL